MGREQITRHFQREIRTAIEKMSESDFSRCQEIRLRVNRSLSVFSGDECYILGADGVMRLSGNGIITKQSDIKFTFESVCQYSVHSFSREIRDGFITVAGGHRAGFCGTAVQGDSDESDIETVKNISGLNLRIAREKIGVAGALMQKFPVSSNYPSVLICGGVGSGKTTMLRDYARLLGNRSKVCVIDTRGELAAIFNGIPQNDCGVFTDVFDGYEKDKGIETAVRVMSPRVIVCDEIGSPADIRALRFAALSGVSIAAAIHAKSVSDIFGKGIPKELFEYAVFLKGSDSPSQIDRIVNLSEVSP
jgi:stage III sporulation protein AA